MNVPKEINGYCPSCKTHTKLKVKVSTSKFKAGRTLAWRSLQMARRKMGHHGKVKGKAKVKKQGIRNKVMLECTKCKKKHERVISGRMKKKAEILR
jgi:large subunit ribosomal protein L44e